MTAFIRYWQQAPRPPDHKSEKILSQVERSLPSLFRIPNILLEGSGRRRDSSIASAASDLLVSPDQRCFIKLLHLRMSSIRKYHPLCHLKRRLRAFSSPQIADPLQLLESLDSSEKHGKITMKHFPEQYLFPSANMTN